jgi:hypothetical protein
LHDWVRNTENPPDRCAHSLRHGITELRQLIA